jgi:hypothetical protein
MISNKFFRLTERALMLIAALSLLSVPGLSQRAIAQSANKVSPRSQTKGGPQEAIKIRGHWIIEVRNPDGRLVKRSEFDNSLTPGGSLLLSLLLRREERPGKWAVALHAAQGRLLIQESGPDWPGTTNPFKNLVLTPDANTGAAVLSGNATASEAMDLTAVETINWTCPIELTAAQCAADNPRIPRLFSLTRHELTVGSQTPPVHLDPQQIVQVTVTISFPYPVPPSD